MERHATTVSSAELVRRFGHWQDSAAHAPLFVTHHGRERLVMLSMENYRGLVDHGAPGPANDEALRLSTVLDRIGHGFLAIDGRERVVEANPAASAYLHRHRDALIGLTLSENFPDSAGSLLSSWLQRAARSGETGAFDAPSFACERDWLHFQTFPYGNGAACLFRAITDEVEMRRMMALRRAFGESMGNHGTIGQARLSARATFDDINEALAKMAGFEPAALLRVRLVDILPLKLRAEAADAVEAVLGGEGGRAFDSALLVNRGGELPVRIALGALRGDYACDGAVAIVTPL